ncbi:MAG: sigma-70 family RNA polymerase sigma factor [Ruminococcaceae bacterium]|nr:sigma-70 family RNA polymerase sigma factor [Oscillospiraceae bacterium]
MNLERFYRENYHIVFGYLLSLCGNPALAEDLTSETFLKAITKIGSYDGRVKPSTWLCAIGKNLYLNERKRFSRHVPLDSVAIAEDDTMEERINEKDTAKRIEQLSRKLEEPKNQVFAMRLNGLSFREIGEALGRTENWARVTFFRAKNEILAELEGE